MSNQVYDFRNPDYITDTESGGKKSSRAPHVVTNKCLGCGITNTIVIDKEDHHSWLAGGNLIQHVFPWLTIEQREILKTGIHTKCWDAIFEYSD